MLNLCRQLNGYYICVSITTTTKLICLRLHTGSSPDHWPSTWQSRVMSPSSMKPKSQVYMAIEPTSLPIIITSPLGGSGSGSHWIAVGKEKLQLHVLNYSGEVTRVNLGCIQSSNVFKLSKCLDSMLANSCCLHWLV